MRVGLEPLIFVATQIGEYYLICVIPCYCTIDKSLSAFNQFEFQTTRDTLFKSFESLKDESIPKWAAVLVSGMEILVQEIRGMNNLITKVKELEDYRGVRSV